MAEPWFKVTMDIFSHPKIKYLRRLPEGDSIVLFWVALLSAARRCNSGGNVYLTENIPYTSKMLSDEFSFEENTVTLALEAFKNLNMIELSNGFITISGWEEYQNVEGLERMRERKRVAQAKWREKKKELPEQNIVEQCVESTVESTVDSMRFSVDHTEEDIDKEIDIDIDKEKTDYKSIVDLYHSICKSFPNVRSLSDSRKKAIKARLNTYSVDDFKTVFENAEASSFLKGKNDRNWSANFDWMIADKNFVKILEGNYADRGRKETVPGWCKPSLGDAEMEAIQRVLRDDPP